MTSVNGYWYQFMLGTSITLSAWISAALLSIAVGLVLGICSCSYFSLPLLGKCIRGYTFVAKGIPAYVYILIFYFVLPALLGIKLSEFYAATLALAFSSSGYTTEIIRAGINTIPNGQWQACAVLGYPCITAIRRIILPQAFRNILPSLMGEFEQLLKSSSLLAVIGVTELTRTGMNIISRELNPIPIYCTVALIYLVISGCLQLSLLFFERRFSYGQS